MDKTSIWKLATRQLPPDKEKVIWDDLKATPEHLEDYKKIKRTWSLSAVEQPFSEEQVSKRYKLLKKQIQKQPGKLQWLKQSMKYAAAIAISLVLSHVYFHYLEPTSTPANTIRHVQSGTGAINSVELADGSIIWLNANSSINITSTQANEIEMGLSGEALFDIIHDENRQFIVNVKQLSIEDLGTRFTVRNYPNDNEISTTLIEGEVEIKDANQQLRKKLKPGQQLRYSLANGSYTVNSIDTSYAGVWTENKFEFVDKTLADIATDIENWYGVTINFKNDKVKEEHFTGVIQKSASVEKVLDIIAYTAGFKYSINHSKNEIEIMIH